MSKWDMPTSASSGSGQPGEVTYIVPVRSLDVTSGTLLPPEQLSETRLTEQARALLLKIADKTMAETVRELIAIIERTAYTLRLAGRAMLPLPPIRASIAEDGSVILEWTTQDFRLGFNIEHDPSESGFYLATSKRLGEKGAHGLLSGVNKESLVPFVVNFVLANS